MKSVIKNWGRIEQGIRTPCEVKQLFTKIKPLMGNKHKHIFSTNGMLQENLQKVKMKLKIRDTNRLFKRLTDQFNNQTAFCNYYGSSLLMRRKTF